MADSLRTDGARAIDDASQVDRDAKIEQVLLAGLDHYFAQRYEQAINVWTRALFFDRSHARARAYIDRARSALAERQRQSEELLQNGAAALDRGQGDEARRLLQAAVDNGAHADDVHPLLDRLSRHSSSPTGLDDSSRPALRMPASHAHADGSASARAARRSKRLSGSLAVLVVAIMIAGFYTMMRRQGLDLRSIWRVTEAPAASVALPPVRESSLPVVRRGELALGRARVLVMRGRLREALTALDLVRSTDSEKAEADRVRADIQRQLLGVAGRQP
jgi:tetratricopeptide (TPR) repeat protein